MEFHYYVIIIFEYKTDFSKINLSSKRKSHIPCIIYTKNMAHFYNPPKYAAFTCSVSFSSLAVPESTTLPVSIT